MCCNSRKKQKRTCKRLQDRKDDIHRFHRQFSKPRRAQKAARRHPDRRGNQHGKIVQTAKKIQQKGKDGHGQNDQNRRSVRRFFIVARFLQKRHGKHTPAPAEKTVRRAHRRAAKNSFQILCFYPFQNAPPTQKPLLFKQLFTHILRIFLQFIKLFLAFPVINACQ